MLVASERIRKVFGWIKQHLVLNTTVSIKQVIEAQNATNTSESAGDTSWILDKITSIIANRISYE